MQWVLNHIKRDQVKLCFNQLTQVFYTSRD